MSKKDSTTSSAGHPLEEIVQLAKKALLELTPEDTFSEPPTVTSGVDGVTVGFPSTQAGYPGWVWTVDVNDVDGITPTVRELQMTPGPDSLLSPAWIPWSDRMEEYLAQEKETQAKAASDAEADHDDDDDEDDFDLDVDGIDIDELDPTPLEIPGEVTDVFDHVEFDEPDPLDP